MHPLETGLYAEMAAQFGVPVDFVNLTSPQLPARVG
jgi:hypothetical protein